MTKIMRTWENAYQSQKQKKGGEEIATRTQVGDASVSFNGGRGVGIEFRGSRKEVERRCDGAGSVDGLKRSCHILSFR